MYNKVVWSEGMFLHPQHFQQQDRHVDFLLRTQLSLFHPYCWGFENLELDEELLTLGKIGIKECRGLFLDGTCIDIPHLTKAPEPIDIPSGMTDTVVYLAIPLRRWKSQEITDKPNVNHLVRYEANPVTLLDSTSEDFNDIADLQVATLRTSLIYHPEECAPYSCLAIAHIKESIASIGIQLDPNFIAPALNIKKFSILKSYLNEVFSLLHHRSEMLSYRVSDIEDGGVSEIADFMLLQLMNRYEPLFQDLLKVPALHPYQFYKTLIQLLGEISTFTQKDKKHHGIPDYAHEDLAKTFHPLMTELRQDFLRVLSKNATSLAIERQKANFWVARLPDVNLLDANDFILAVHAHVNPEELRHDFPQNFKIAPVERIMDLVTHALPGISLQPLSTVPRKIPFYGGYTYFSLDKASPLWKMLELSNSIGFHSSKPYPDLKFELWSVYNKNPDL